MGFLWFSEQTSIISLNNTNQLNLVTELYCAFFEVTAELNFGLQKANDVIMVQ
jgi:hypothetical protein